MIDQLRFSVPTALAMATGVAGTLDLGYALVTSGFRGVPALVLLQSVASGLIGKSSFQGGIKTAILGAALHYTIMASFVIAYYLLSRRFPLLHQRPLSCGPLWGLGVFAVMNYLVVPLSAIGHLIHRSPASLAGELFSHIVFVGLTIAWFVSRTRL